MPSMSQHDTSPKKPRTQFTPKQLRHLEEKFLENQFPNAKDREAIANELDLTQQHIQVIMKCILCILLNAQHHKLSFP